MIYYEVNVELNNEIYDEYMKWLTDHVQSILDLDGFVEARIMRVRQQESTAKPDQRSAKQTVVVVYELISDESLNNYLKNHAPMMRQSTLERFGDQLKVTRRELDSEDLLVNAKIMDEFLHDFEDCNIEHLLETELK